MTDEFEIHNLHDIEFDIYLPDECANLNTSTVQFHGITSGVVTQPTVTQYPSVALNDSFSSSANAVLIASGPSEYTFNVANYEKEAYSGNLNFLSPTGYIHTGISDTSGAGFIQAWLPFIINNSDFVQGFQITSAVLKVVACSAPGISGNENATAVKIKVGCELVANAAVPASGAELCVKTLTSQFGEFVPLPAWTTGTEYSFDITKAVQEVLNLSGWTYGDGSTNGRLAVLFRKNGQTEKVKHMFASYSNGTYAKAKLVIS